MRAALFAFLFCLGVQANPLCSTGVRAFGIVEPYSSGWDLLQRASERGLHVLPIFASHDAPSGYSFDRTPFADRLIIHHGDIQDTVNQLVRLHANGLTIAGLATGSESGGPLSDSLREGVRKAGITVRGNGLALSEARRDKKFLDLVLPDDLKPRQIVTDDFKKVEEWLAMHGAWPVMVKQPLGAGGEKSRFCYDAREVRQAFDAILGRRNGMLEVDKYVVIQEVLNGPEIGVNGVRAGGITYFSGLWEYTRPRRAGAGTIYDLDWLLQPSVEKHQLLMERVSRALDYVGHTDGPFHVEAFLTALRGPLITDANIRLSGHRLPWMEARATDRNPLDMTIDAHINGRIAGLTPVYTRKKYAGTVSVTTEGGAKMSYALKPQLEKLKADGKIADFAFFFPDGQELLRTVDSDTVAAAVWVDGEDRATVRQQLKEIQRWRDARLFEVAP